QAGRAVEGHVAVPEEPSPPAAELVAPRDAGPAVAAADDRLDGDAIADVHAPALRRPVADALDHAERLVPGHDGQADGQDARVLLRVAPADTARLDTQQRAVVVDVGDGQLAQLEAARRGLHDGAARPHGASKHGAARRVQALAPEPVLDDDWGRACSATAAGRPSRASGCRCAAVSPATRSSSEGAPGGRAEDVREPDVHSLLLDGVFAERTDGTLEFRRATRTWPGWRGARAVVQVRPQAAGRPGSSRAPP